MTRDSAAAGRLKALGPDALNDPDALMPPVSVAEAYWQLYQQPRSAWTFEMEVRPNFAEYPMTTTGMPSYTTEGRIYAK